MKGGFILIKAQYTRTLRILNQTDRGKLRPGDVFRRQEVEAMQIGVLMSTMRPQFIAAGWLRRMADAGSAYPSLTHPLVAIGSTRWHPECPVTSKERLP